VTFVAVIAGFVNDAVAAVRASGARRVCGRARLERIVYSLKHQRVRTILLLFSQWASLAVVRGADAGLCRDRAWPRGKWLRPVDVRERGRAFIGALSSRPTTSVHATKTRARCVWLFSIALFAFAVTRNFYLALVFLTFADWHAAVFLTSNTVLQTIVPDEMRAASWRVVARVRRDDSAR